MLDKNFAHLNYSYSRTSHGVQGRDAKDVYVSQSAMSFVASNNKQFYVSSSRGTERITIYTDDKDALREAVAKSGDRMSATALYEKYKVQTLNRLYRRNYTKRKKARTYESRNIKYQRQISKLSRQGYER